MSYTGQLGTRDSTLGSFALGLNSLSDIQENDILTFTESYHVNLIGFQESETLTFTETNSVTNPIKRVAGTDVIAFTETPTRQLYPARGGSDVLAFDETSRKNMVFAKGNSDTLAFSEIDIRTGYNFTEQDNVTFVENQTILRIHNKSGSDVLVFSETPARAATFARLFSENIEFKGGYIRRFGNGSLEIFYPEGRVVKKQNLFILKGFNSVVTLPNPEFDDSESNADTLTIYRSMNNDIYTFVKVQPFKKLSYSFTLTRLKSIELRRFFDSEKSNKIEIQNHKTEIWIGYLITNPVQFTTVKRAEPCGEQVEVTLDFEAVRVS